jgi:hypothetical protein
VGNHALLFEGLFNGLNLIANLGRGFEFQRRGFLRHLLSQF